MSEEEKSAEVKETFPIDTSSPAAVLESTVEGWEKHVVQVILGSFGYWAQQYPDFDVSGEVQESNRVSSILEEDVYEAVSGKSKKDSDEDSEEDSDESSKERKESKEGAPSGAELAYMEYQQRGYDFLVSKGFMAKDLDDWYNFALSQTAPGTGELNVTTRQYLVDWAARLRSQGQVEREGYVRAFDNPFED